MLKTKKKVIKLEVIKRLAELFPDLTIKELLEYIDYCHMIKQEIGIGVIGVTTEGSGIND